MKFHNLEDAPVYRDDLIFKQSSVRSAVPMIIFGGIAVSAFLAALKIIKISDIPRGIEYAIAATTGLFGLVCLAQFRATLGQTNWLLRANQSGLLLKYRSYLNRKLPASDVQVVALDYGEIAWARKATEKRTSLVSDKGGNARRSESHKFLDLCLATEFSAFAENLKAEISREAGAKSHWEDYPVQLLDGGIVRIRWQGISPGLDRAIKALGGRVEIKQADISRTDYATTSNLNAEELKQNILKLSAAGDKLAAYALVKKALRCSLTEAVRYVEKVQVENP